MMRTDLERIGDIFQAIDRSQDYYTHLFDEAYDIRMVLDALQYNILVIGEAANHLSPVITESIPNIKWDSVTGMRNMLAHEYFGVDMDIVVRTVENDLPDLKIALEKYVSEPEQ